MHMLCVTKAQQNEVLPNLLFSQNWRKY